jgi:hypothetical protein
MLGDWARHDRCGLKEQRKESLEWGLHFPKSNNQIKARKISLV